MKQFINSDSDSINPEMLAAEAFDQILDVVKRSNLNFQLQVTPFSAYISLRKSLVTDKSGNILLPPAQTTVQSSLPSSTSRTVHELENDLIVQKNKLDVAVNDCKDAHKELKICQERTIDTFTQLEKENKALKQSLRGAF